MNQNSKLVVINAKSTINEETAIASLGVNRSPLRRSYWRGAVGATIALLLFLTFAYFESQLRENGILPEKGTPIPAIITALWAFMVAGASSMLMASARFFSQRAKEGFSQITAALETMVTTICAEIKDDEQRKEGLNIMRLIFWALMLHASGIKYVVKGETEGSKNCWDLLLTRLGFWAKKNGIFGSLMTSSAGNIRLTMGRNVINMVVRFGLRTGVVVLTIGYFVTFMLLIACDMSSNSDLNIFIEAIIFTVLSFLMTTLIFASYNESNPLLGMGGKGQHGLGQRLRRFFVKISDQEKEAEALHAQQREEAVEEQPASPPTTTGGEIELLSGGTMKWTGPPPTSIESTDGKLTLSFA